MVNFKGRRNRVDTRPRPQSRPLRGNWKAGMTKFEFTFFSKRAVGFVKPHNLEELADIKTIFTNCQLASNDPKVLERFVSRPSPEFNLKAICSDKMLQERPLIEIAKSIASFFSVAGIDLLKWKPP